MVVGGKNAVGVERLLRRVYDVYADFAMKNPFYELEQPIQAELFEERVMIAVRSCRNANSSNGTSGGGGGGYPSSGVFERRREFPRWGTFIREFREICV